MPFLLYITLFLLRRLNEKLTERKKKSHLTCATSLRISKMSFWISSILVCVISCTSMSLSIFEISRSFNPFSANFSWLSNSSSGYWINYKGEKLVVLEDLGREEWDYVKLWLKKWLGSITSPALISSCVFLSRKAALLNSL